MGEQRLKEYGERLIKNIQQFVKTENLEDILEQKKASRPAKTRKVESTIGNEDGDDEWGFELNESDLAGLD